MTPKEKIDQMNTSKLKALCSENVINKVKRQPVGMEENICISDVSDQRLISRIYKELLPLNDSNKIA